MNGWSHEDQAAAQSEGWLIAENSDHGTRIERFDDAARFDCDAATVAFVGLRAVRGNPLAKKAFQMLAWHHSVEDAATEEEA
jgi:hypothetical protein